jgi:hypothetical protein
LKKVFKNSTDELKLRKAIRQLEAVQEGVIQKLGSSTLAAQSHIGVITSLRSDLEILYNLLKNSNSVIDTKDVDSNTSTELLEKTTKEVTKSKGGRPKGSTNKAKV